MAASPLGIHKPDPVTGFDRHRFDNYSGWLDLESKKKAKAQGKAGGFGYAELRPPPGGKTEKPFYVLEPSFCSGLLVRRKYDQIDVCGYKTEEMRTDPHHYPNHLEVKEEHHFQDFRRKSQNIDPRQWKPDPLLAHVVPESMVQQHVAAHRGQSRANIDPQVIADFFDDRVRPAASKLRDLNCDLSCVDLPSREGGFAVDRAHQGLRAASSSGRSGGKASGGDWSWCMGGRKPVAVQPEWDASAQQLMKSRSMPQMTLDNSPSMLHGNMGGVGSATFHGVHTRKFGGEHADQRKRGGKLARDGWAGTFPARECRAG